MTYTVYIDVLFAVNLLMDGILLFLVRSCLRLHAPAWRILLAAGAGAAWGCLAEVRLLAGPAAGFPGLLGAGTAMVWIAFEMGRTGTARARLCRLAKGTAALFAAAFVCGGAWAGIETFLLGDSSRQEGLGGYKAAAWLLLAAGAVGAGRLCLLSAARAAGRRRALCRVRLFYRGRQAETEALLDTGNRLYSPEGARPVHVLEYEVCRDICGGVDRMLYIPYQCVGRRHGLMPGIILDRMEIFDGDERREVAAPLVGIVRQPLSADGSYHMLLHEKIGR